MTGKYQTLMSVTAWHVLRLARVGDLRADLFLLFKQKMAVML